MNDSFKNRGSSEEAKFKNDAETRFKIEARRDKMLGFWAAEKLGLSGDDIEAFAKKVVVSDLEEAGHEDVVRMVSKSFSDGGVDIDDDVIRAEIKRLQVIAEKEVTEGYSEPLGSDHGRVGG
ncbi:MAG: DUF1476 domain-containing protein [Rhodospirillaceae bacterium]|jgi:hypothetical protein|nr:DUF1476 domain-containing protein [Rhodospirillaceae bacterium]MBT5244020.1 DUF1476 domain-containing protein [Rhodospirillaceae bacterium]MBT5560840.1 DUF1476 domain-containing protein [Rhodospirillaceae bacterium]MBT6240578.1 DUF1476 domain-containing protein [Rhodospirillaceae bacterium]MBT7138352.1 DUF1476 domain-containing protein [Rhodospirillaceae bacterium]